MIETARLDTLDSDGRAFLLRLSSDSLFLSPEFGDLWRTMNGRPVHWVVSYNDKKVALLPGVEFGSGPLTRFQSMPEGCYGSLLIDQHFVDRTEKLVEDLIGRLIKKYSKLFIFDFFNTFTADERLNSETAETIVVDISGGNWEPPDKKERWAVRKAERDGLALCEFDKARHLDWFMKLMSDAERRHDRKPRYTRAFFEALAELSVTDNRVRWVVCESESELIASHIYFVERKMLFYWQSYCDQKGMELRANDFILGNLAMQSSAQGLELLNLGSSPVDADGLKQFKLKWGGRVHAYPICTYRSRLGKLL
jgi:hypothetical protein